MHTLETFCLQIFITAKIWAPTESHSLLLGTEHLRKVIVQLAEAFLASPYEQRLLVFSNCLSGTQWGQGQNSSASAGRKSNSLPTIFSTNVCYCLQVRSISGLSLVLPQSTAYLCTFSMLRLTKELMKSTRRPRASCKTSGGEKLVLSDWSGS